MEMEQAGCRTLRHDMLGLSRILQVTFWRPCVFATAPSTQW